MRKEQAVFLLPNTIFRKQLITDASAYKTYSFTCNNALECFIIEMHKKLIHHTKARTS